MHVNPSPILDFNEMAAAQRSDPDLLKLHNSDTSLILKEVPLAMSDAIVTCDTSTGVPRPDVPSSFRHPVFDSLRALSHPSIRATQMLITARYVWPGINSDVR